MDEPVRNVAELWTYPVKSCGGVRLTATEVYRTGMPHDREWMVVDTAGCPITQRKFPRLALVDVDFGFGGCAFVLCAPGMEPLSLPRERLPREKDGAAWFSVQVWGDTCTVVEPEPELSGWFREFLWQHCRLVRSVPEFRRREQNHSKGEVLLADTAPLHIISIATLKALEDASSMRNCETARFRPNVVVKCDGPPGIEAQWKRLRFGTNGRQSVEVRVRKPTTRCKIPAVNPKTGIEDGGALIRALAARENTAGIYAVPTSTGIVQVGDPISVLE
ncbi:MAG: MOSC N-terminal beta barrel domain-containing protein [Parcubacteria group bacterium]|nr:MOSC N-terminal beta barrel domain-containing protein [Parcubacteria group bacterium]MBI2175401.1 MOSC N-terminal beta barrel domain-containing protein [Parcubacteria group bacterium]